MAPFDLTGLWQADDGGVYVVRQIEDTVWWLGLSNAGAFYPGLAFCNVFSGKMVEQLVYGQWSDVPRGATANHGDMTLLYIDSAHTAEQELHTDVVSGGFGGSTWRRLLNTPAQRSARDLFEVTLKNVQKVSFLWWGGGNETLADNLQLIRDSASVFGVVTRAGTPAQMASPVSVGYPADRDHHYGTFVCSGDDQGDGDLTFHFEVDHEQITQWQQDFFTRVDSTIEAEAWQKMLSPVEGELIMFGRSAGCDDPALELSPPLFPGWAEPDGSSPLFNGVPIPVQILPPGVGSNQPNFITALAWEDAVRVTGALVFDIGHERGLEIHPVYSVDVVTSTLENELSGTWADDHGDTYYLRHDLADNSVWYAGLSPLGGAIYGQVFRGTFEPATETLSGNIVAVSFGYVTPATPLGFSSTPLGETGHVAFRLGQTQFLNREVMTLIVGNFRLIKLHDDLPAEPGQI
jgi:hypothetical protein